RAARLDHPNIVKVLASGLHCGKPYVVTEHVEGASLLSLRAARPLDALVAMRLVETLAHAVHHAHQQGIVHGALRADSVVLVSRPAPLPIPPRPEELTDESGRPLVPMITGLGTAGWRDGYGARAQDDVRALGTILQLLVAPGPSANGDNAPAP